MVGAFLIVGGFLSYHPVSADATTDTLISWGPIVLASGLALLAIGFIMTIFLFYSD